MYFQVSVGSGILLAPVKCEGLLSAQYDKSNAQSPVEPSEVTSMLAVVSRSGNRVTGRIRSVGFIALLTMVQVTPSARGQSTAQLSGTVYDAN